MERNVRLERWLTKEARRLVDGCRVLAFDGVTQCYTPDATGKYGGMWIRDFYFLAEALPEYVPESEMKAACRFLLNGQREDGVLPDRRYADGMSVYSAGPAGNPTGEPPADNAAFMAKLVCYYVERSGDILFFEEAAERLERALGIVGRSEGGLVFIAPGTRRSSFGFLDQIAMTGNVLLASEFFAEGAGGMARAYQKIGEREKAAHWRDEKERVCSRLEELWSEQDGMYYAAGIDNRQIDVWGSCYAAAHKLVPRERALCISERMVRDYEKAVRFGQVRHLFYPEFWKKRLDTDMDPENMMGIVSEPGRYQNGAYWAAATGWASAAIRLTAPALADSMLAEAVEFFQKDGIYEAVNDVPKYRGAKDYVISAALVLAALRQSMKRK